MKRDNEQFKSKTRDESYIKDKRPDIQLGRHTEIPQTKPIMQSKKNRMYQSQQEPQQEFSEATELEQPEPGRDIPKSEPLKQTQKAKRRIYHQHTQNVKKSADLDIPQKPEATDTAEPPPPSKTEDYNIRDVVQDGKTEFSRNTDIDFSETVADKEGNIAFDKVTRVDTVKSDTLLKRKQQQLSYNKTEKSENMESAETAHTEKEKSDIGKSNAGDIPFDCVKRFEQKAEKARAAADF